ncbi:hypothetical protein [Bacteroides sp.]|uniref:hypothetical protein n=1 Tax=Bacteroides sp. TaxID=29523 RepID=UPI00262CC2C3|nr:hypothetical protein [Bacteroides sp.]
MRVIRSFHPEATIILPDEKISVHPGDDVRSLIATYVAVIRLALDHGVGEWKGHTSECCIKQVRHLLTYHFYFHEGCISDKEFNVLIEDLLYVHKSKLP